MSLSAPAATSENKLPEVSPDAELKAFFTPLPTKRGLFKDDDEEDDQGHLDLDALKAVFSAPPVRAFCHDKTDAKAKVAADTFGTSSGPCPEITPDLRARINAIETIKMEPPNQLQLEEENEERQRADELRHNVAVRRANLALQRTTHPLLIRATAAKYLRLGAVLKQKIIEKTAESGKLAPLGVSDLLKYNKAFIKGVKETLDALLRQLTVLMEEDDPTKLPSPAELAAQAQQTLGTLGETFQIDDLTGRC